MTISIAQFIDPDEYIVKQPRVAMTNNQDTLPPRTRDLDTSPLYPPPENIGEIGSYTTTGDELSSGDYAVEYMVWVKNEGTQGKIADGDIQVYYARNSAWQTRFEFSASKNRWVLVERSLGIISNSPRLSVDDTLLNDYTQRDIDFIIKVNGITFTVDEVDEEADFTSPSTGHVQFAKAEGTFHFNEATLDTYADKQVTYTEIPDGQDTVSTGGIASLERGLTMTFQENPDPDKKDLSLDYTVTDEQIVSYLSGVKTVRLSFVPETGSVSLRYDPVPDGYPETLVENTDFTIDTDTPAIRFTTTIEDEYLARVNPLSPGDKNTSQYKYDILPTLQSDLVPNSLTLVRDGTTLTQDTDYLVDWGSGMIHLTKGYTSKNIFVNHFTLVEDFSNIDFTLYLNEEEITGYSIIPSQGWVNLDTPLFPGDVLQASYVSTSGVSYSTEFLKTPAIVLSTMTQTICTEAVGGEQAFVVQHGPIALGRVEIAKGVSTLVLSGDKTFEYPINALIQLEEDVYRVTVSVYTTETTLTLGEPTRQPYTNPTAYRSCIAVPWTADDVEFYPTPMGSSTIQVRDAAPFIGYYTENVLISINNHIYVIKAATQAESSIVIQLKSKLTQAVSSTDVLYRTNHPMYKDGDTKIKITPAPIMTIPDGYDGDLNILSLNDRFTGIGDRSVRLYLNESELIQDVHYTIDVTGTITLYSPISSGDTGLDILYLPVDYTQVSAEYTVSYAHYSNAPSGVALYGSMDYQVPDTFYFRVVSNPMQATVLTDLLRAQIKQKKGQVSSGSSPSVPISNTNATKGMETPIGRVGDLYDNDFIAQRIYDFYTQRIEYLESEKRELCGEIPGGYRGPITASDFNESAYSTGRLYPTETEVLKAIKKAGQSIHLPGRPYRVPVLFGLPLEDDRGRLVMDSDYPTFPVTTFPPWPPQGQIYKGSNQEPNSYGILGIYSTGYAASSPSTFVEDWYPSMFDITDTDYIDYTVSPAVLHSNQLTVNQDTGDPDTATVIFPPEEDELNPNDFSGVDLTSHSMPTYQSVAPRYVPVSYEGAAIGAVASIDSLIESDDIYGHRHRMVSGDDTTYPTDRGWTYRDSNEFDLISIEKALLQAEWIGVRPVDLASLTDNAQRQILSLLLQRESLLRQDEYLDEYIGMYSPVSEPELTTGGWADAARDAVADAIDHVNSALTNIQNWYDTVIIDQVGVATDEDIIQRWLFLTGVDATGSLIADPLPTSPVSIPGRDLRVTNRITEITDRIDQIQITLGYDKTVTPDFSGVTESEKLYTARWSYVDVRLNRDSGTLFKALSQHAQYVRDLYESESLQGTIDTIG